MTTMIIFRVGAEPETRTVSLEPEPGYDVLKGLIDPCLGGGHLEHVTVLHEGQRTDMFVDDESVAKGLPRNEAATAIYRNNWLTQHPEDDPESLPAIYGPAILMSRRVWF